MAIRRSDLQLAGRPKTVVVIEGLGEVIVQALSLSERLSLFTRLRADDAKTTADTMVEVPEILSRTVVDPDGKPLMSVAEWQDFGATDAGMLACMKLHNAAQGLMTVEKKASKGRSSSRSGSA